MPRPAQQSTSHLLILCACPDQTTAQNIANQLVDRAMAACVSILPGLTSIYQWQGKRETAQEHLLLIKTTDIAYPALEQAVTELHPYELPEVIAVPITQGLNGYLQWIEQQTATKINR
ncbi:MAG TPA: divalent-cation tolerance protein CutA [Gammaproteobacteria bacterium]|nr:divalent-cation tolerance protein CutA [Gammaproteobacteria bacterium]